MSEENSLFCVIMGEKNSLFCVKSLVREQNPMFKRKVYEQLIEWKRVSALP
jgi:hypothetical protein